MPTYKRLRMGATKIKHPETVAILDAFNRKIAAMKENSLRALIRIQAKIYDDMDTVSPKIPVHIGNLRRSYYAVTSNGAIIRGSSANFYGVAPHKVGQEASRKVAHPGDQDLLTEGHASAISRGIKEAMQIGAISGPAIVFGFSAYYAPYVHEMVGADFSKHREGAGAKFFSTAVHRNASYANKIIAEEAKRYKR